MKKIVSKEFYNLLNNRCSAQELDNFLDNVNDDEHKALYLGLISSVLEEDVKGEIDEKIRQRLDKRLALIINSEIIETPGRMERLRTKSFHKYAAAALIFLTLSAAIFFLINAYNNSRTAISFVNNIQPGGNKAILTLFDGSKLSLSDIKNGELVNQSGIKIVKTKEGELIYTVTKENSAPDAEQHFKYNILETPRGGQYRINLPDGTRVWLNAQSSLKFPQTFAGFNERRVELSGEAYFEVSKDKSKPFKVISVSSSGIQDEIEVLGTHFNLSNYSDDKIAKTTLLEGSVRVTSASVSKILKPGQQSILSSNRFEVKNVDVEEVVSWKNGFFIFENDNLEGILRKIARWYDVDISYDGHLNHVEMIGAVSRSTSLAEVLDILEKTDKFKFKLKGRRILVMP
ncbi:FecR family protein [Pedobacter nyackensis]|uniref:FecR family protein n=1 Tax=Pedobacter nyackensis TaxID=475255 RepID=UPI00292F4D65|nr:FecR domain-containing protein [Pedobacter nyackensis]